MSIRIQKLDHFAIYVTDLERAEKFYGEFLGMALHARIGAEQSLLKCGDALLALFVKPDLTAPADNPPPTASPLGRVHFAVTVSRADWTAARQQFLAAGIPTSETIGWGDHDCYYVADPDGNLVELMTYL